MNNVPFNSIRRLTEHGTLVLKAAIVAACLIGGAQATEGQVTVPVETDPDFLAPQPPQDEERFTIAVPSFGYPRRAFDTGLWELHEGVNVNFTAGMSTSFGHGPLKGAGFGQSASLGFAKRLNSKFSYAVILQGNHLTWGPLRHTSICVTAAAHYQPTDRFSLYVYATKSLAGHDDGFFFDPYSFYPQPAYDRIGAIADLRLGENSYLKIGFEAARLETRADPAYNRYAFGIRRSLLPFGGYDLPY